MQKQLDIIQQELKINANELNRNLVHQYRNVRRIAREKPEQTVAVSLFSGLIIGYLVSKIIHSGKETK